MNNSKKGFTNLNRVIIIQLVIMLGLSLFITHSVSSKTKQNSIEHMGAITDERAYIITNYVKNSEKTLRAFSKSKQVTDLLEYSKTCDLGSVFRKEKPVPASDPALIDAQKLAQDFTIDFGRDIDNLEGLWIGSWDTFVLTQTNPDVIGMQTRSDTDRQEQLHWGMANGTDGLYNTGIIISPASGKQCLSMYQAVYSNGKPIGFVGLGIFTEDLVRSLDAIPIKGIEKSFYSMVNTKDYKYIFNIDENKIANETESLKIKELCDQYRGTNEEVTGSFEYIIDGKKYVSTYTYIPEYDWLLMIDDETAEAYALSRTMTIYLGLFGVIILGLVVVFNIISRRQEKINQKLVSTIAKNNQNKKSLNTAMFKDVLTNAGNRVSFAVDMDKLDINMNDSCYFILFNISNFSDINVRYGNDAGDSLLVQTVNKLYEVFKGADVYRTGSDEFVVVKKSMGGTLNSSEIRDLVDKALAKLTISVDMGNDMIAPRYKAAIARRSSKADTSVISVLKELTNRAGDAKIGSIDYIEM